MATTTKKNRTTKEELSSTALANLVVQGMQERKAQNIVLMDLRHVKNAITDYFVVCSGTSDTQIDAIADSVEEEVHKASRTNPWHREGKMQKEWILIDYVDVVAHVFKKDRREFYKLEDLWGDAEFTYFEDWYFRSPISRYLTLRGVKTTLYPWKHPSFIKNDNKKQYTGSKRCTFTIEELTQKYVR